MKVTRTSPLTQKVNTWELDITPEALEKYHKGALIQDAFPNLTPDEREFFMTGYTPEDWKRIFVE